MFEEKNNNLDDLIGGNQPPIIVEKESNDKKFLYTLLILLVVLFLVALGLIAFLGSKYFGGNSTTAPVQQQVQQSAPVQQEQPTKVKQTVEKAVQQVANNTVAKPVETKVVEQKADVAKKDDASLSDLEQLVKEEEKPKPKTAVEKSITKVAKSAGKGLSQEELATIAKLVAQELAKSKAAAKPAQKAPQQVQTDASAAQSDAALVASLQQAQTDTLKDEQIDTTKVKKSDVKASGNKKVDTFNKVVVQKQSGGDDELAKLSSEIDTILQSEDVQKEEKGLKFKKALDKEANVRAGELRFIVVKKGDTLSSIAYRAYGRWSAYTKIYKANPDLVKNPNRIYVGMRLRVPVDAEYKAAGNK